MGKKLRGAALRAKKRQQEAMEELQEQQAAQVAASSVVDQPDEQLFVLDTDGDLCGVVEGIVPLDHADKRLAGSAAFIPSFQLATFVDFCERQMLQQIMPTDLFQMVVNAKKTNSFGGGPFRLDEEGNPQESRWDDLHATLIDKLKQKYSPEEVETFLQVIRNEGQEVLRIMDEEGGEMDDIIARVRAQTMAVRDQIHDEFRQAQEEQKKAE